MEFNGGTKNFNPVDYRDPKGEYTPVSVEGLATGLVRDLDLYVRAGSSYFLVKPKNMDLNPSMMSRFWGSFPYLYIHLKDRVTYFKGLESNVNKIISSDKFGVREKASVLTDYAVEIVDQLLKDPASKTAIKAAQNFADQCVNFIGKSRHAFIHLVELSQHDHYTYSHSVGVAAYAAALGQALGTWSQEEVSRIALAGLLHDLGKVAIDPNILNKTGPLSEAEWESMKKHPTVGADLIRKHKHLPDLIALCAEAHHEDLRGLGYPKGLVATNLDASVQVITISDAFSALTTNRSYSKSVDSMTALKLMRENIGKKFIPEYFERFVYVFLDPNKAEEDKAA